MLIAPELGFRYLAAGGASLAIAASKAFVQRMRSARQFLIDINPPLIFGKVAFVMRIWKDLNVSGAGAEHMDQRLKKRSSERYAWETPERPFRVIWETRLWPPSS